MSSSSSAPRPPNWQLYLSERLMCEIEGHRLTHGAFISHEGYILAQTQDFPSFARNEVERVFRELRATGSTNISTQGFLFGGQEYTTEAGPNDMILGTRTGSNIAFKLTDTIIVIGIYNPETSKPAVCNQIVRNMGRFLVYHRL